MSAREKTIDPRTRAILADMTFQENMLLAYPQQLPREDYVRLNAVLEALGGKWQRGSKAKPAGHVFPINPEELIEAAIETGSYTCPKLNDFFVTPAHLVDRMIALAGIEDKQLILEPSAGDGAIADRVRDKATVTLHVVELLPENLTKLREKGHVITGADFMEYEPQAAYDRVLMNPPFSKRQDVIHVRRAYDLLKPGGRLVAIMAAGITFRQDRLTRELRDLIDARGTREALPEKTFHGTDVNTVIVTLEK
jgi:protein-L-isoaspartate O-methyltransferase